MLFLVYLLLVLFISLNVLLSNLNLILYLVYLNLLLANTWVININIFFNLQVILLLWFFILYFLIFFCLLITNNILLSCLISCCLLVLNYLIFIDIFFLPKSTLIWIDFLKLFILRAVGPYKLYAASFKIKFHIIISHKSSTQNIRFSRQKCKRKHSIFTIFTICIFPY